MEKEFEENTSEFDGTVPLFPLPNLVMFPGLVQPLHVFEPRYRQMAADALAGNRIIAMALLQPGYESSYESKDCPIHSMVCMGSIDNEEHLDEGRCNFLFHGLKRARIINEVSTDKLYRIAQVDLMDSWVDASLNGKLDLAKEELIAEIGKAIPALAQSPSFPDEFAEQADLGLLCDLLCFSSGFDPEVSQAVLEELDVMKRFELVKRTIARMRGTTKGGRDFPPEFSVN